MRDEVRKKTIGWKTGCIAVLIVRLLRLTRMGMKVAGIADDGRGWGQKLNVETLICGFLFRLWSILRMYKEQG